jgi:hypothetical protein
MNFFSKPSNLFYGREWVKWRKKGLIKECRGNFSQKETISWARRGSEIRQIFSVNMARLEMIPQDILLYAKRMVIWLGEKI